MTVWLSLREEPSSPVYPGLALSASFSSVLPLSSDLGDDGEIESLLAACDCLPWGGLIAAGTGGECEPLGLACRI